MKRRQFLKLSSLSTAFLTPVGRSVFSQTSTSSPYILVIECSGGWDQTLVFDNKVGSSTLNIDPGASLTTGQGGIPYVSNASLRPNVDTFFNSYGSNSTIVNGILCHEIDHEHALSRTNAVINADTEQELSFLPYYSSATARSFYYPHLSMGVPHEGGAYSPVTYHVDIDDFEKAASYSNYTKNLTSNAAAKLNSYLASNYSQFSIRRINDTVDGEKINGLTSKAVKEFTGISAVRANYDASQSSPLLKRGIFALNMFASSNMTKTAHILDESLLAWDTHQNALNEQSTMFNNLFRDLKTLLDHATNIGIADDLVVIVKSEIGRDSRLSVNNKDHWPYNSCLIWSKLLTGSKTVGKTDDYLRGKKLDPVNQTETEGAFSEVTYDSIFAAIFENFGVSRTTLWGEDLTPTYFIL